MAFLLQETGGVSSALFTQKSPLVTVARLPKGARSQTMALRAAPCVCDGKQEFQKGFGMNITE